MLRAAFVAVLLLLSSLAVAEPVKILSLGDSYTIGEAVPEDQRWPNLLADQLNVVGINTSKPQNIARTGWTTANLAGQLRRSFLTGGFDWVTLMIGVNDQYQDRSIASFSKDFQVLLDLAITQADSRPQRVLVLSVPDWSVSPFGHRQAETITAEIQAFNDAAATLVQQVGAIWIDITDLVELAREDDGYIANDRLHFSGKMHALWAARVAERIQAAQ